MSLNTVTAALIDGQHDNAMMARSVTPGRVKNSTSPKMASHTLIYEHSSSLLGRHLIIESANERAQCCCRARIDYRPSTACCNGADDGRGPTTTTSCQSTSGPTRGLLYTAFTAIEIHATPSEAATAAVIHLVCEMAP